MEQKPIREYNGQTYSISEGAELVKELDDRTRHDENGYNSIAELAARIQEIPAGEDGREIELQTNETHIQWRYVGDGSWTNLIALSELKGEDGEDGEDGEPGPQGEPGTPGTDGDDGVGVPAGGTTGQVLKKKSDTNYDTEWDDETGGGGGSSITPIEVTVSTVMSTVAKIGTTAGGDYSPNKGDILEVTFTSGNTATNPTLNIDGSGAKAIELGGAAPQNTAILINNRNVLMYYDGAAYQLFGSQRYLDSDTTYTGIAATPVNVTTTTQSASINRCYLANNASLVTINLPTNAAIGSLIAVIGVNTGGYRVQAASGDNIVFFDGQNSGSAGYVDGGRYTTIYLRCIVANTTWLVEKYTGDLKNNNDSKLSTIRTAKVTITTSELKNANTNPVTLISAPGAGKVIAITSITGLLDYNSSSFSFFEEFIIRVGSNAIYTIPAAIINGAVDNHFLLTPIAAVVTSGADNDAVTFSGGGGSLPGGGELHLIINYIIDDFN